MCLILYRQLLKSEILWTLQVYKPDLRQPVSATVLHYVLSSAAWCDVSLSESSVTHCCRRWGWWRWGSVLGCSGRSRPAGKPGCTGGPRSGRIPPSAAAAPGALRAHTWSITTDIRQSSRSSPSTTLRAGIFPLKGQFNYYLVVSVYSLTS